MNSDTRNRQKGRLLFALGMILLFALYWIRIVNLDQDLPPWGVACYQPKDEGCYAVLAINRMEYGTINPSNPLAENVTYPMYVQEHVRVDLLGNLLEMLSFSLFGDNYYGLRSPMVAVGFVSLILSFATLLLLRKRYGRGENSELLIIWFLLLLNNFHFYNYLATRTVEPSLHRMLFVQLTVLIWLLLEKRRGLCFFALGLCITVSVFLVYITNVFLYLVVAFLLLVIWWREGTKPFLTGAFSFIMGALLCLFLAEMYYIRYWNTSALGNMLSSVSGFTEVTGYEINAGGGLSGAIHGALKGAAKYISAFFFLYAPSFLLLSLLVFPFMIWKSAKEKDLTLSLLFGIPIAFLLQTMVSEDYIWRKFITVSPVFLYMFGWAFFCRDSLQETAAEWYAGGQADKKPSRSSFGRFLLRAYVPFAVLLTVTAVIFHLFITTDDSRVDFSLLDKALILGMGCLPMLFWCADYLSRRHRGKKVPLGPAIGLLGCTTLLLNLCFLARYVWIEPTFEERDMQISLSEDYDLDNQYVIGDCVMGITLYNNLKPVYDVYSNYASRMIAYPDLLMLHYASNEEGMEGYINNTIFSPKSDYTAREVSVIPGTFQTFGEKRDFALYKAVLRSEKVSVLSPEKPKVDPHVVASGIRKLVKELGDLEKDNLDLSAERLCERRETIQKALETQKKLYSELTNKEAIAEPVYGNWMGDLRGDLLFEVYGYVYGTVYGDITRPLYGAVYGDVYGNIEAPIYGEIYGDVYGDIYGDYSEQIHGVHVGKTYSEEKSPWYKYGDADVEFETDE